MQNLLPPDCAVPSQATAYVDTYGCAYVAGRLTWQDCHRHDEYQKLRAKIFVEMMGWDIPVDTEGREKDRYDQENEATTIHCVYGINEDRECILGGVRLIAMKTWSDSMLFNEFRGSDFVPKDVVETLNSLDCQAYIEITRFCVQQGRLYPPTSLTKKYQCAVARDLTYAGVYALSQQMKRPQAIGIAHPSYLRIMRQGHFRFAEIHRTTAGSLVIIDLWQTIRAIQEAGDYRRAQRMLWYMQE
jgi:N-acyl-L-homoserine lactone synthetase